MSEPIRYSAGTVTAYGAAVRGGYSGTYEEWCQDMANLGDNVAEVRTKAAQAAQSASDAAGSAGAAAASATEAGNAQTAAEDAQTAAETAQGAAETAAQSVSQSAAQIETNRQDISDLKSAINDPIAGLNNKAPAIIDTASGSIASFPDGADGMPLKQLVVNIEPVQAAGTPTPESPLPISGWTGANVYQSAGPKIPAINPADGVYNGVTVQTNADGSISFNGTCTANESVDFFRYNMLPPGITRDKVYTVMIDGVIDKFEIFKIEPGNEATNILTLTTGQASFNFPLSTVGSIFRVLISAGVTYNTTFRLTIAEGDTINRTQYDFPTEAGTVYGGTLDVVTGKLAVNRKLYTKDNSARTVYQVGIVGGAAAYLWVVAWDAYAASTNDDKFAISNMLKSASFNEIYYGARNVICQNRQGRLLAMIDGVTSVETLESWLVEHPDFRAVETINTSTEIQLTPQEITTLLGANNIWADCGPVSVDYPADTKLYIQKINAPTDDDMTADTQITSGKYFIIGNNLYLSTTTIPAGDTIIPGTNCQQTNLAEALNALNV